MQSDRISKKKNYGVWAFAIAAVAVAAMLVASLPLLNSDGSSADGNEGYGIEEGRDGNVSWRISEDTLFLQRQSNQSSGDMSNYLPAERPGWEASQAFAGVTKVVIHEGVRSVGSHAFYNCTQITSVTLAGCVERIGDNAFSGCTGLTELDLGAVRTIGQTAFFNCAGLTSLTLPRSVEQIGAWSFGACFGLKELTLPITLDAVGDAILPAFYMCNNIQKINFTPGVGNGNGCNYEYFTGYYKHTPWQMVQDVTVTFAEGIWSIGFNMFRECTSIKHMTLDDNIRTINAWAFTGCSIETIGFGKNLQTIGYEAFRGCYKLSYICIPDNVQTLGPYSFADCSKLSQMSIPISLDAVGDFERPAFFNTKRLVTVYFTVGTGYGHDYSEYGWDPYHIKQFYWSEKTPWFISMENFSTAIFSNGIKYIGDRMFAGSAVQGLGQVVDTGIGCRNLKTVELPDTLEVIGPHVFHDCRAMTGIDLPDGLQRIGICAFTDCASIRTLDIPGSVKLIESEAFVRCISLTSLVMREGVEHADSMGTFACCYNLTYISFPSTIILHDWGPWSSNAFQHHRFFDTSGHQLYRESGYLAGHVFQGADTEHMILVPDPDGLPPGTVVYGTGSYDSALLAVGAVAAVLATIGVASYLMVNRRP